MSKNEDRFGFITKIVVLILCVILMVVVSNILSNFIKDYQNQTNNMNENALAIIVIGFNLTLFQILWFILRLFEARHNPNEEKASLNKQDQDTNIDVDSNVKTEVHIALNQNKGDA